MLPIPPTDHVERLRREGTGLTREARLLRSQCKVSRTQMAHSCAQLQEMVETAKARIGVILELYERHEQSRPPPLLLPLCRPNDHSRMGVVDNKISC